VAMSEITPIEAIYGCLKNGENFVLQGGAGSGKTETLKRTLSYISKEYPNARVACITHTNFAVQQIMDRVGDNYTISTIHSFLNQLTKDYKENIHQVIDQLFFIDPIVRTSLGDHDNEKTFNQFEHGQYKDVYDKYAKRLFQLKKESMPQVTGKKEYDKDPKVYNDALNSKIVVLNKEIKITIAQKDFVSVEYNETQFNSLSNLTYGHDGLLDIACILVETFKILRKMLADKYDYIFIDEYQDTAPNVIDTFIRTFPDSGPVIGLFGDSVQAIYEGGVGDVNQYIDEGLIRKIEKKDNFRCSEQVINFANKIRYDGLSQKIALKRTSNGQLEKTESRQGKVEFLYAESPVKPVKPAKPRKPSAQASKEKVQKYQEELAVFEGLLSKYEKNLDQFYKEYSQKLDDLIVRAQYKGDIEYTVLKLTNKSIARDVGFSTLFEIFNNRYLEVKDEIEKKLSLWQFQNLFELCDAYQPFSVSEDTKPNYNEVIGRLKKNGFQLRTIEDKQRIQKHIQEILNSEGSAFKTLEKAFSLGLLKRSESNENFFARAHVDQEFYVSDKLHKAFKKIYSNNGNTFNRFSSHPNVINHETFKGFSEEDFDKQKRDLDKETFLNRVLDDKISFQEILNYYCYLNEYLQFMTMHKTKGGEIDNVLVVLDEYSWPKYDFINAFKPDSEQNKREKNANLIYVACTRAKINLRCVRLVKSKEEEDIFLDYFSDALTTKIKFD
jgi:DNA helicase-2/ATP-dependent DNA helicase PcrA